MKKLLALLLGTVIALSLTGCGHTHEWKDATCETPKTCTSCEETEGEALGHNWAEATCESPKTCTVCAATEGSPLEHSWEDATCAAPKTCTLCGETDGEALLHNAREMEIDDEHFTTACPNCGTTPTEKVDWEKYAGQLAADTYTLKGFIKGKSHGFTTSKDTLTIQEDGTAELAQSDGTISGTWRFVGYSYGFMQYELELDGTTYNANFLLSVPSMLTVIESSEGTQMIFLR